MAPSRGATSLLVSYSAAAAATKTCCRQTMPARGPLPVPTVLARSRALSQRQQRASCRYGAHLTGHAFVSGRAFSTFAEKVADTANGVQSYVSNSDDPFLNLAIEDYMLRKSPENSTILFLYVNRPCVVIGRNQNPWTEVNLGILNTRRYPQILEGSEPPQGIPMELVRRRSGGGTVFHDEGNLNWSIICPRGEFTRDKHAEMTVRALRKLGIERARVNERHDIVLDQGHERQQSDPQDTHRTPYTVEGGIPRPLKVSGSAYKLTRQRALHHATTLLCSPNLHAISSYLRSPSRHLIKARGVESVSSPVTNIGLPVHVVKQQLQKEFAALHGGSEVPLVETVGVEQLDIPDIRKGFDELKSQDWMWSQTPQFDLSFEAFDDKVKFDMNVRHGIISNLIFKDDRMSKEQQESICSLLVDQKLHDIGSWASFLQARLQFWDDPTESLAHLLDEIMPNPVLKSS